MAAAVPVAAAITRRVTVIMAAATRVTKITAAVMRVMKITAAMRVTKITAVATLMLAVISEEGEIPPADFAGASPVSISPMPSG